MVFIIGSKYQQLPSKRAHISSQKPFFSFFSSLYLGVNCPPPIRVPQPPPHRLPLFPPPSPHVNIMHTVPLNPQ